jgi:CheY-like chemotaxis protein
MIDEESSTGCLVLFVDDEKMSQKYFRRVFGGGRTILTADNGYEALKIYEEYAGQIGIVVTDQIMPRLTGLEVLRNLQEKGSPVARVLSTAYTDSQLVQEAVNGGLIDYFVSKPWDLEKLEDILQQAEAHYLHRLGIGPQQGQVA